MLYVEEDIVSSQVGKPPTDDLTGINLFPEGDGNGGT